MRSPINAAADWISRRSPATEDSLAIANVCLMVSTFITLTVIGAGIELVPVLFG